MFDIVIPLGPNEVANIHKQIQYTKQNVIGFRNIYIISYDPTIMIEDCIIIEETIFPFKMSDVAEIFERYYGKKNRNGWYFQQLLKLYVGFVVPDILDNYLVIDADVFFLKPTEFILNDKMVFSVANEYHITYFEHMNRLHPTFEKQIDKSGISHHMLFNKKYIQEIFGIVETRHNMPFWKAFLEMVDEHKKYDINHSESGASEYELYFNYVYKYHNDSITIRTLKWDYRKHSYEFNDTCDNDFVAVCNWYY